MWFYIIILLIVVIVISLVSIYNKFVSANNMVKEAFSTMDVYLKKRWDLIPNLVETVKGYTKHEEAVLKEVTTIRSSAYDNMSNQEKFMANSKISTDLGKIMALAENYPDLKASTNFIDLSNELSQTEEDIANARKYYNGTVKNYNNIVEKFPANIFAKILGFARKEFFEATNEERENVIVKL
jgi:LemA protein